MLSNVSNASVTFPSNTSISPYVTRKLRIFLEPENLTRAFEFEVVFKIFRNRTYVKTNTYTNNVVSSSNTNYHNLS